MRLKALSFIPKTKDKRERRIWWSKVSNAADKSSIVNTEMFPLSTEHRRSFTTRKRAVSVLWQDL